MRRPVPLKAGLRLHCLRLSPRPQQEPVLHKETSHSGDSYGNNVDFVAILRAIVVAGVAGGEAGDVVAATTTTSNGAEGFSGSETALVVRKRERGVCLTRKNVCMSVAVALALRSG